MLKFLCCLFFRPVWQWSFLMGIYYKWYEKQGNIDRSRWFSVISIQLRQVSTSLNILAMNIKCCHNDWTLKLAHNFTITEKFLTCESMKKRLFHCKVELTRTVNPYYSSLDPRDLNKVKVWAVMETMNFFLWFILNRTEQ